MTTLNSGYYNNTSCSPGSVQMPNSSQNPITLTPVCNPIDKQLINTIISYLISNDIFILNQQTDTQQTPGQFNISNYGKANSFLAKNFLLLSAGGLELQDLKARTYSMNSLGDYYGAMFIVDKNDFIVAAENIVFDGQIVLPTDLPSDQKDILLTIDGNGLVNEVQASDVKTMIPNLQEVTDAGNSTSNTIVQQNATTDFELVPYGQMVDAIANLLTLTPEIITIILDWLAVYDFSAYVKVTEKATQGGVQTLGLDGLIPIAQLPQITLQWICNNGHSTTTTISAADAVNANDLVTLGQLTSLISAGVGTLDQVLTAGNISSTSIQLEDVDNSTILSPINLSILYDDGTLLNETLIQPGKIVLQSSGTGFQNVIDLHVGGLGDLTDRLLINLGGSGDAYLVTSEDFGHTPQSGLPIDQDLLDGKHGSEFILKTEFPINLTGQSIGNVLTFNGSQWVPGTGGSGGGTTLTHFAESLTSTYATWAAQSTSNSLWLKTNLHKTLQFGSAVGSITGTDNFLYCNTNTGPTVNGSYNIGFINVGTISGSHNVIFSETANISSLSTYNFVYETASQIGTSTGATYNILMLNSTAVASLAEYSGSYSVLLNNTNTNYNTTNTANSSFIANNNDLSVNVNDFVAIKTYQTIINAQYSTAINAFAVTLNGQRSFASGYGLTTNSYANVAFGTFATVEASGNPSQVVDNDRQFFVGSGTGFGNLRNAITVWKSGMTEINGALKIGEATDNETGSIKEGSLRYYNNDKAIEIYRNSVWSRDLSNAGLSDYIAWSKIKYPSAYFPGIVTVTGGGIPIPFYPGTLDLSTGPNAVNIVGGTMNVVTPGFYNVHVNATVTLTDTVADDQVTFKIIGGNITQNITILKTIEQTGTATVNFNFSMFSELKTGESLNMYITYLTGQADHDMTPVVESTIVDFVEVKNVQQGSITDDSLGWIDNLRQMYIRNTSLNNTNTIGETGFQVVSVDGGAKTITVNQDIPVEVDEIPYDPTKRWAVTMGYAKIADIVSIDVTRRIITYNTMSASILPGEYVEFFNPWVNYQMDVVSPILETGNTGTWQNLYKQPSGGWKKNDGTFMQIITGVNSVVGTIASVGLQSSPDLVTWSFENGGDFMYVGGVQPFNNFEIGTMACGANPVKTGSNTYMGVYAQAAAGSQTRIGWMEFDEDFNIISKSITPIVAPGYTAATYSTAAVTYFDGKWLVYAAYRPSVTQSTWKILEMEMDDIKTGTVNVVREVFSNAGTGTVWNGKHMDSIQVFVSNGELKILVSGTGTDIPAFLFGGNRNWGLVHRTVVGGNPIFTQDTRNPIFSNPVNGSPIWGAGFAWCNDHVGGGMSTWVEGSELRMCASFNASSNTYKIAQLTFDNSI